MVACSNIILFSTLPILVVAMSLTSTVEAQENTTDSNGPQFLAIQHAQSGSITTINGSITTINSTNFLLQLNDMSDKTILFSDRPDRIVVTQSIDDFIGNWTEGKDSFQVDPPNAALVTLEEDQEQDIFEIELFNPKYDQNRKTLSYDFTLLGNTTIGFNLPKNLGKSVLVIDQLLIPLPFWFTQTSGNALPEP